MSQKYCYDLSALDCVVAELGAGKILLVCDENTYKAIGLEKYLGALSAGIVRFSDFKPNPLYENVCAGIRMFNGEACDAILAIGGGSAIDVAKCIKLYCALDHTKNYLKQEYVDSGVPLIAVPTTAGTGSESTRHAVIYYEGVKQSISHVNIIPNYVVLDHRMLFGLPVYQKKCTMLDALSQAIESWWSVNSTEQSAAFSKEAITLIKNNWSAYLNNDENAAAAVLKASNLSGQAINITATTAPHAMSYKLSSMYALPHGHAVALSVPLVWEFILAHTEACHDARGAGHLAQTMCEIEKIITVEEFSQILCEMNITGPVSEHRESDIEVLTGNVNPERLKNNPVLLTREDIQNIYERIIK